MNKLETFLYRLERAGVKLSLTGNYPWIYIDRINNNKVTETFQANHGFCIAYMPVRKCQDIKFTDIGETFKLIRKYINKTK